MQENVLPEDFPPSEKAPPNRVPVEKVTQKKPAQKKPAKASSKKATQRKASQKKVPQRKAPKKKATLKNSSQKKTIQKKMPLKKTSLSAAQAPVEFNGVASHEMEMLEESEELRSPAKSDDQGNSEMSDASGVSDSAQEIDYLEVSHGLSKYPHTTHTQREAMVLWMGVESNRAIYLGESTAGKGMVHGTGVTKREGFKRMTSYVHTYAMKNQIVDTQPHGTT
ncbi:hypothetical protein PC129_g10440 [Phytophthora cactorum]|uniref:Uncharacterized protein n=1 Tax=Phytophthora cactorum TaxID=29920 RepID=A0A329SBX8_9STRA|nr:hypothetical protein Pcac1_g23923 [Phytophthora cactorum]KAG2847116.1 hypothetical protein PC111_g904 [Phytophthora cactorum]KAG2847931.1 hypothetical protein PC112_g887 [Phytophthora cactorum]KAG2867072.1 hypothetical protein PC113_g2283 [Phytophthora cactorum]KAG2933462.1 hypothetical protein PC114_g1415 [Phytophthora cactorum]